MESPLQIPSPSRDTHSPPASLPARPPVGAATATSTTPLITPATTLKVMEENDQSGFRRILTVDIEGRRHGTCYEYAPDETLFSITQYNHGIRVGDGIFYKPDGSIFAVTRCDAAGNCISPQ